MAGPIEILIVVGIFGITGLYLYLVHRFLRGSESETKRLADQERASPNRQEFSSGGPAQPKARSSTVPAEANRK